jgi:malate/lactate dehydrogenase
LHIAQVGTGRVGRPCIYSIMCSELADIITVCDTKPGLAVAFAEDLKHAAASLRLDVEIIPCEKNEVIHDADIILVSAGEPRIPGFRMSRRDLVAQNAKTIKTISLALSSRNVDAKYIVITNPVDAMAMICKKYTNADFVISTGTNLESLRFRSRLAETLDVPPNQVEGWVGGEHGDSAISLWSTTKIAGSPVEKYSVSNAKSFSKNEIDSYLKTVSKFIVDNVGGTEYGPAASFRDITRAIVGDTNEVLSIAAPVKFEDISEPTFVGVPTRLGKALGPSVFNDLSIDEKEGLNQAAKTIFQVYESAIKAVE